MRRLLFNPLDQESYASGEYDAQNVKFVLDKSLEYGHLYYARIICTTTAYQTCCLIDTCNYSGEIWTTPFAFIASNDDFKTLNAYLENNTIVIDGGNGAPSGTEKYSIYIYKLM